MSSKISSPPASGRPKPRPPKSPDRAQEQPMNEKKHASEETLDEPVMDGSTEEEASNVDPRKGQSDPALIRHPEKDDKTSAPYNL